MTKYHIHICDDCSMRAEISVKGEVWCGCGALMQEMGYMEEFDAKTS